MKKFFSLFMICVPMLLSAQTAIDAFTVSQTDLKGTARYMSMAGAYGALGGDLSSINKNPGGIGVYRSSDIGLTLNLDFQSVQSSAQGVTSKTTQTKFTCNNLCYVGSYKLNSNVVPFINWGISYNKPVSFNRRYSGKIGDITSSLSNYIANVTNMQGYTTYDLAFEEAPNGDVIYNPYIDSYAPWLSIMAFESWIINPQNYDTNGYGSNFTGLLNANTRGFSEYEVIEQGSVNEFNLNFGGNIADMLYWGVAFGLDNLDFSKYTYYGEGLTDANVANEDGSIDEYGTASFGLENWLTTRGSGWDFSVGVIYKPINELRIGLAFHTPKYWSLTDEVYSRINYQTINSANNFCPDSISIANNGNTDRVSYKVTSPWQINASIATIIGGKAILSFDYDRIAYNNVSIEYPNGFGAYSEDKLISNSIKDYYKAVNIFRVGGEYRVSPKFSLRLGYAYQTSPVNEVAMNDNIEVITSGTMPAYTFDKSTQYFTGGLGYRSGRFYTDLAYVHKMKVCEYNAFSSYDNLGVWTNAPSSTLTDHNNQLVWSIGYRF